MMKSEEARAARAMSGGPPVTVQYILRRFSSSMQHEVGVAAQVERKVEEPDYIPGKQDQWQEEDDSFIWPKRGTSFGSPCAPTYTIIYLGWWERKQVLIDDNSAFTDHVTIWLRYIDDILIILDGAQECLDEFINKLNTNNLNVKLTHNCDLKEVDFLDITISKDEHGNYIMTQGNETGNIDFILKGLSVNPELKIILFVIFFFVYTTTLSNTLLIVLTRIVHDLHTPMYIFICNLSLLDVTFTLVTVPKMLVGLLFERSYISYNGCFTQIYFFHFLGSAECFLLSIMGYDRYVAICNPLRYPQIMSQKKCVQLAASCWITGFFHSLIQTLFTASLSFCRSRVVNHFHCDVPPLFKLSCTVTRNNMIVILALGGLAAGASFLLTLISYVYIISTILQIHSADGRHKTFSTCGSHLTVVSLYYGTIMFMYLRPRSSYSPESDKIVSILYTTVTPMLNPIIYSMRNKDVKASMRSASIDVQEVEASAPS
ncbi:LOW QUALITY PROTEIN: olfactory receptor 5AP2-like [Discoglossus pictus]